MSHSNGFPPVARKDAKILILGSMPGQTSLKEKQYYAHLRNSFWPIICALLNTKKYPDYRQRKQLLLENRIALWDVLKRCCRKGSLDSAIDHSTIELNDFQIFFDSYKQIKTVFFNGGEAERLFKKYILKDIEQFNLEYYRLPSTSPAHAAKTTEQKLLKWQIIKKYIF